MTTYVFVWVLTLINAVSTPRMLLAEHAEDAFYSKYDTDHIKLLDVIWPEPDSSDFMKISCWRTLLAEEREPGSQESTTVQACTNRRNHRMSMDSDSVHDLSAEFDKLKDWFEKKGGELHKVAAEANPLARCGAHTLVAQDDIEEGESVVRVPLSLGLSQWSVARMQSSPARAMKEVFQEREEWGLALMLLHEFFHGEKSRWWPYIATLRACEVAPDVSAELAATSLEATMGTWWAEVEDFYQHCQDGPFRRSSQSFQRRPWRPVGLDTYRREELGWALRVVRQRAVRVVNPATRGDFLALLPLVDLVTHTPGGGGDCTLHSAATSDFIQVTLLPHHAGQVASRSLGNLSDAEAFSHQHALSETHTNPHARVRLQLPEGAHSRHNILQKVKMLRSWREQMGMPPRSSDLLAAHSDLRAYGRPEEYETPMIAPSVDSIDSDEVAYMHNFVAGLDSPEPGSKEHRIATSAARTLTQAASQLQRAEQAAYQDPTVQAAVNATRDLLMFGVEPEKGLDGLDLLLIRKMNLRTQCGEPRDFTLQWERVSPQLLCALRVTLMSEAELNQLCPPTLHWADGCEGELFRWRRRVSRENEALVLSTLRDTLGVLLSSYPTSKDDDHLMLSFKTLTHPRLRSAILLRMREKELLTKSLRFLDELELQADNSTTRYQLNEAPKWRAPLMLPPGEAGSTGQRSVASSVDAGDEEEEEEEEVLCEVRVDFGGGRVEMFKVLPGQSLQRALTSFKAKHALSTTDALTIAAQAQSQLPSGTPNAELEIALQVSIPGSSSVLTLALYENETVGDAVAMFWQSNFPSNSRPTQGDTASSARLALMRTLAKRHRARQVQRELLRFPISVPDGRKYMLSMKQGDQHNIANFVTSFVESMVLPVDAVQQLINVIESRLPKFAFNIPVSQPEPKHVLNMRVMEGDDPYEVSIAFCVTNELDDAELVPKLVRLMQGKMRSAGIKVITNHFFSRNAILEDF